MGDLGELDVHPTDSIHNFDGVQVTGDQNHNAYGQNVCTKMVLYQCLFIMIHSDFAGSQRHGMPFKSEI